MWIPQFFMVLMVAISFSMIAIISVQNATPIALQFLGLRSVFMPFGVVLAFCVGIGAVGMTLIQALWSMFGSAAVAPNPLYQRGDRLESEIWDDDE